MRKIVMRLNRLSAGRWRLAPLAVVLILSGCSVGPDYHRPSAPVSATFKEAKGWAPAIPHENQAKGAWWDIYRDPQLSALMAQVQISNQNVAQYAAQYREAQALVTQSRASLLPTVDATGSTVRKGTSTAVTNTHTAELTASWELDLWGKLRRGLEEEKASAQASAADLANATLSAQSSLAQDYFQLRVMDAQIDLYQQSIDAYQRYLTVIQNQYQQG